MRKAKDDLTFKFVSELLEYDAETGVLTWKGRGHRGRRAGRFHRRTGYLLIGIRVGGVRKSYKAHRLAWLLGHGKWPDGSIDHRSGMKTDNRLENLREATTRQSARNRGRGRNNTSGVQGVHWHRRDRRWIARIRLDRRRVHLGSFTEFSEAVVARLEAEQRLFGEFAPSLRGLPDRMVWTSALEGGGGSQGSSTLLPNIVIPPFMWPGVSTPGGSVPKGVKGVESRPK